MVLESERLLLRPFLEKDLADILVYGTEPNFYKFLPIEEQTEETLRAFFDERMADQIDEVNSRFTFAVALKPSNQIIGTLRIGIFDEQNRIADLGYAMDLRRQGSGFMTEAVRRLLWYCFGELNLTMLWATVDKQNNKSWRLLERVGMVRSKDQPSELRVDPDPERNFVYQLSKSRYLQLNCDEKLNCRS
jgi:RimJ/RimL family protein N-acetyltransferase